MSRSLHALAVPAGPDAVPVLVAALRQALDGTGPALLPLPAEPAAADRVRAVLRPDDPQAPLEDDAVALVVPTSGSTGEPKGVLLTPDALAASAAATYERAGGPGRWLLALPVTHIAGLQVVLRSLAAGTEPVVLPGGRFTAEAFVSGTGRLGPGRRYTSLVPTQLRRLMDAPDAVAALGSYDAVLVGAAATPPGLLREARSAGVRVLTTYGMSETSGGCVYDGQPLPGVRVELDDDGRIRLSGPVLARGYRLRPDLTAAAFGDGGFRTDDVGRLDASGRLVVLGRADDLVVTGGEKVAPAAVEAALAEHPSVEDVAVLGVADPEWGQRVVAVVVLVAGRSLSLAEAREHVAGRLSRLAAPRELRVVEGLPMLPTGKVDRAALRC